MFGLPASFPVFVFYAWIQKEQTNWMKGWFGEVMMMRGILLNALDEHEIRLFSQLMKL